MNGMNILITVSGLLVIGALAQSQNGVHSSAEPSRAPSRNVTTVRGCLDGERGNYIVVEDKTSMVYALKGVGNKLDKQLHHEVEVNGTPLPGRIKTGVRPEKAGSNPSDTAHGVDGIPFQVANVETDVRTVAKHCKATDSD